MIKKIKALIAVGVLALGAVGCSSGNASKEDDAKK